MTEILLAAVALLLLLNIVLLILRTKTDSKLNIEEIEKPVLRIEHTVREEISRNREETSRLSKEGREELNNYIKNFSDSVSNQLNKMNELQIKISEQTRTTVEQKLSEIQNDNNQKLEKMRETVDEKLNNTLEKRLGDSFRLVSERLEMVHRGLGEMQNLASGVGKLEKVLSNVKTKGILGEYQLSNLLEQILTPEQYSVNVKTKAGSNSIVEFAVKLPGKEGKENHIWLPIDSKFPTEDYQVLMEAYDRADTETINESRKSLINKIKLFAKDIMEKYIDPPNTTDFGILFLPFEGIYAEVLRNPGLFEQIQREYKIVITGPTTLAALLNSLQMGFRTLAIEKRSSEVWEILGAIKTEFKNFGEILIKTKKKLEEASNVIDKAETQTKKIQRKLRGVEELNGIESNKLLGVNFDEETAVSED